MTGIRSSMCQEDGGGKATKESAKRKADSSKAVGERRDESELPTWDKDDFAKKVKTLESIADTLFLLGPKHDQFMADRSHEVSSRPLEEIKADIEKADIFRVISQYPDFNREVIETDESQRAFALSQAFPYGYQCKIASARPPVEDKAAFSQGGGTQKIYTMLYTFYEDLEDYHITNLEY